MMDFSGWLNVDGRMGGEVEGVDRMEGKTKKDFFFFL